MPQLYLINQLHWKYEDILGTLRTTPTYLNFNFVITINQAPMVSEAIGKDCAMLNIFNGKEIFSMVAYQEEINSILESMNEKK